MVRFSSLRVRGRYWMILKRDESSDVESWRRIGLAQQGKYSWFNPTAEEVLRSVNIVLPLSRVSVDPMKYYKVPREDKN